MLGFIKDVEFAANLLPTKVRFTVSQAGFDDGCRFTAPRSGDELLHSQVINLTNRRLSGCGAGNILMRSKTSAAVFPGTDLSERLVTGERAIDRGWAWAIHQSSGWVANIGDTRGEPTGQGLHLHHRPPAKADF